MRLPLLYFVVLCLGLAGCRRDSDNAAATASLAAPGPSRVLGDDERRLWQGVLPCRDCLGIDTRLRLTSRAGKQDFTLQEIYLGAGDGQAFERSGPWIEATRKLGNSEASVLVLDPGGAAIAIRELPDGALEFLGPDGQSSRDGASLRLQRQAF